MYSEIEFMVGAQFSWNVIREPGQDYKRALNNIINKKKTCFETYNQNFKGL